MKIIGFNFTKVSIEKKEKQEGKLEVKQNINIEDIIKDKINISDEEVLKVSFGFNVDYSPNFANLELKGVILLIPGKEDSKKILKEWKDKKMEGNFKIQLFNFIIHKCNLKALTLEDELGLPLHVPMPRLNPEKE